MYITVIACCKRKLQFAVRAVKYRYILNVFSEIGFLISDILLELFKIGIFVRKLTCGNLRCCFGSNFGFLYCFSGNGLFAFRLKFC